MSILLLFGGSLGFVGGGTVAATGTLTKEITRGFAGTITPTGLRVNVLYQVPVQAGTLSPTGTLSRIVRKPQVGALTLTATTATASARGGAFQTDMNVGFYLVLVRDGTFQVDEDVIALTALLSRDGLLQVDENMRPKSVSVTSY